jgi:hypothetical protein
MYDVGVCLAIMDVPFACTAVKTCSLIAAQAHLVAHAQQLKFGLQAHTIGTGMHIPVHHQPAQQAATAACFQLLLTPPPSSIYVHMVATSTLLSGAIEHAALQLCNMFCMTPHPTSTTTLAYTLTHPYQHYCITCAAAHDLHALPCTDTTESTMLVHQQSSASGMHWSCRTGQICMRVCMQAACAAPCREQAKCSHANNSATVATHLQHHTGSAAASPSCYPDQHAAAAAVTCRRHNNRHMQGCLAAATGQKVCSPYALD